MICINCNTQIDNDSKYCDSCGQLILICIKCKQPGVGKFCGKDGGKLIENPDADLSEAPSLEANSQNPSPVDQTEDAQTIRIQNNISKQIKLRHKDFLLEIQDGDILGRKEGKFVSQLNQFAAISGKHCQFSFKNGWFVSDLNSTNGISLNGSKIEKMKPVSLNHADELLIADQLFKVEI